MSDADELAHARAVAEELRLALAKAEAHSAEKTRFYGAASHDLRQPVHALGLYLSLLLKDPPEAERRALLTQVASCVESLDRLVGTLFTVADAETAHLRTRFAPVRLQAVIDAVLVQFRLRAEQRGLHLRNVPTRVWVDTDAAVLERILNNLVSNALRYTDAGHILVGVRRHGDTCVLQVCDTGIGIAAAEQAKVFDDYYQANKPGADRSHGMGLGLATARRLAKTLGTRVEVESAVGNGSRFSIALPVTGAPALDDATATVRSETLPRNVLVVEDDALVRDALQRLLGDWGVRVVACASGGEALQVLRQEGDADWHVLLDYRLAGDQNGLQVADQIRSLFNASLPIHLITGETDEAVFREAALRGIAVLNKPVKPIRLRALLSAPRSN